MQKLRLPPTIPHIRRSFLVFLQQGGEALHTLIDRGQRSFRKASGFGGHSFIFFDHATSIRTDFLQRINAQAHFSPTVDSKGP